MNGRLFRLALGVLLFLILKKALEVEKYNMLMMCFDRTKLKKEYQTILENLDSGIITCKNNEISFFNSMGKEFLTDGAEASTLDTQKHYEVINQLEQVIQKLDTDIKPSESSKELQKDNLSTKIFKLHKKESITEENSPAENINSGHEVNDLLSFKQIRNIDKLLLKTMVFVLVKENNFAFEKKRYL
jgi:hypothetical protein